MNQIEAIALLAASLIVVSRLPLVFWPGKFKKIVAEFWKKQHHVTAAVFLAISLMVFYIVFSSQPIAAVVAPIFGFATLVGAWMLWDSDFGKAVSQLIYKKSDSWLRIRAAVGVAIGLAVIYFVLQSAS